MNEARKKYLWSVYGAVGLGRGWTDAKVEAVVLAWTTDGYEIVQRIKFVAANLEDAQSVARSAFALWCIAHEEEVI